MDLVDPFGRAERHQQRERSVPAGIVQPLLGHRQRRLAERDREVRHDPHPAFRARKSLLEHRKLDPGEHRDHRGVRVGQGLYLRRDFVEQLRFHSQQYRVELALARNRVELCHARRQVARSRVRYRQPMRLQAAREPALQHRAGHVAATDQEEPVESAHAASDRARVTPWVSNRAFSREHRDVVCS